MTELATYTRTGCGECEILCKLRKCTASAALSSCLLPHFRCILQMARPMRVSAFPRPPHFHHLLENAASVGLAAQDLPNWTHTTPAPQRPRSATGLHPKASRQRKDFRSPPRPQRPFPACRTIRCGIAPWFPDTTHRVYLPASTARRRTAALPRDR